MANIMVNESCNLRCPYCFASELVNRDPKEMPLEEFREALDFILEDGTEEQIGIIGGEPTLYSHINEALQMAEEDIRTYPVQIFTNAVALEKIDPRLLEDRKFRMLVNVNSPEDMGGEAYWRMHDNIIGFVRDHIGHGRVRLSVNLYKPDFDYAYVLELARELKLNCIRMSVSVPARETLGGRDALDYFREMKSRVLDFTTDLLKMGVVPGFDCNFMPSCILTEKESRDFHDAKKKFKQVIAYGNEFWDRSVVSDIQNCTPVIDILPGLQAIRCFGLSEYSKQNIRDYNNITELKKYYRINFDIPQCHVPGSKECEGCEKLEMGQCSGGCYIFKIDKIKEYREERAKK